MNFIKKCPSCGKDLNYSSISSLNRSIKNNSLCINCRNKEIGINKRKNRPIIQNSDPVRNCPKCNKEIYYKNISSKNRSEKNNKLCLSCSRKNTKNKNKNFIRLCPICNKEIFYINKDSMIIANQNQTKCSSCTNKETFNREDMKIKFKEMSSGKNNPMYGKSVIDVWVEKYGKEEANKKLDKMKDKCRIASSGKNNAMHGKPSPTGSGNGWSGWYKGIYFRSLLELSYLKYLIDNNIKFENGEKSEYKIKYIINGETKNYFPDFYLIDTKEIVEIKPKKLINSEINKAKFKAGKLKYGNKFKIITENDINKLEFKEIKKLYLKNEIKFIDRYEEKMKNYISNN